MPPARQAGAPAPAGRGGRDCVSAAGGPLQHPGQAACRSSTTNRSPVSRNSIRSRSPRTTTEKRWQESVCQGIASPGSRTSRRIARSFAICDHLGLHRVPALPAGRPTDGRQAAAARNATTPRVEHCLPRVRSPRPPASAISRTRRGLASRSWPSAAAGAPLDGISVVSRVMTARERQAVRGLLLTPGEELLLMKVQFPWVRGEMWITPGGGVRGGESNREALVREMHEETGCERIEVGPEVWRREHLWDHVAPPVLQREQYFLLRCERFEPCTGGLRDGGERDWFGGFRWWRIDQLPDQDPMFAPTQLGKLMRTLLREGVPHNPVRIGT